MENLKDLNLLISEKQLAEALGLPNSSIYRMRLEGCPWVSISKRPYYHATLFMEWILKKKLRKAEEGWKTLKTKSERRCFFNNLKRTSTHKETNLKAMQMIEDSKTLQRRKKEGEI